MPARFDKTPVFTTGVFFVGVLLCASVNAQTVQQWLQEQRAKTSASNSNAKPVNTNTLLNSAPQTPTTKSPRTKKPPAVISPTDSASTNLAPKVEPSKISSSTPTEQTSSSQPLRLVALIHHTDTSITGSTRTMPTMRTTQAMVMQGKMSWTLNVGQTLPIKSSSTSAGSAPPSAIIQAINDDHVVLQKGNQTVSWNIGTVYEE